MQIAVTQCLHDGKVKNKIIKFSKTFTLKVSPFHLKFGFIFQTKQRLRWDLSLPKSLQLKIIMTEKSYQLCV